MERIDPGLDRFQVVDELEGCLGEPSTDCCSGSGPLLVLFATMLWSSSGGCRAPAKVAVSRPMVSFYAPRGTSMFLVGGHGALKVAFTGRVGPAPFLCASHPWLVDVQGDAASVRDLMRRFSSRPGGKRVMLYDSTGRLLAKGALCIFPTYKTHAKAIKRQYRIRIPSKALSALKRKKGPVALFETYPPPVPKGRMVHVAWALYLVPVL